MKIQTSEVKKFMFYKMPIAFFTNEKYFDLSANAKLLYAILNDRIQLSRKNNLCDEEGNLYTIFPYKEIAKVMNVTERSIANYMSELKKHDLVIVKKQGWDLPSLIFLGLPEEDDNDDNKNEKNNNGKRKNNSSCRKKTVASSNISQTYYNQNNNNNKDTNNLKDTTNVDDETVDDESVVTKSNSNSTKQESNNHKQTNKSEQENNRYTVDDVKRLFELAQQVSSSITMSLLKNLLKHYSYKQIQEKLLYMQKFKQRNTIYNPCGFLVSSLRDNYTFVDKAKAILDKANTAIQKTKEYFKQFRNDDVADRDTSLNYLKSMKLKLGVV